MPYRRIPLVNDHFYHIYNRGSEKRTIFETRIDYRRFLRTLRYYQFEGPKPKLSHFFKYQVFKPDHNKKIVDIICYCLMPNHFHLLLKQRKENGITEFVSKVSNSYTKYFNVKRDRVGPLLQGEFKSVLMESEEQLMHVSRYIHLNPLVSLLVKKLEDYDYSSYLDYVGLRNDDLCVKDSVLGYFKSQNQYKTFVLDRADYAKELEIIKHKLLD